SKPGGIRPPVSPMQKRPTPAARRASASSTAPTMTMRRAPLAIATAAVVKARNTSMTATLPAAVRAPSMRLATTISSSALFAFDDGDADRFERIVGHRRDAQFAVAPRPDDAALEERALVDDLEPIAQIGGRAHGKPGQRQAAAAGASVIAVADPGGRPPLLGENAELDGARRKRLARADAHRLDLAAAAGMPGPAGLDIAAVAEAHDVQQHLGAELARPAALALRRGRGAVMRRRGCGRRRRGRRRCRRRLGG